MTDKKKLDYIYRNTFLGNLNKDKVLLLCIFYTF